MKRRGGRFLHGIDALSEVGVEREELLALLGESPDLRSRTDKYLLLWSSHGSSEIDSGYSRSWKRFKHGLRERGREKVRFLAIKFDTLISN